jgi:hypothetical protein
MKDHGDIVRELATLLGQNPDTFNAFDAAKYMDDLWARWFEQVYPMNQFTPEFLNRMMLLNADYFNQTLASNETTRKLYVTGTLRKMQELFAQRLKEDQANIESDVLKFFFWSDHDDSIIMLANALSHHLPSYPSFASQIIFEFWRTGPATEMNYTVTALINDKPVSLLGPCGGAQECHFEAFSDWLTTISFFRRDTEYAERCQNHLLSTPSPLSRPSLLSQEQSY